MSIIFQQAVRENSGHLAVNMGTGPIVGGHYDQGLVYDAMGAIFATSVGPPTHYIYGLPFDDDDRLVLEDAPITYYCNALPFTASNALAASADNTGEFYVQGIPFNGAGAVYVENGFLDPPEQVQNLSLTPGIGIIDATWDAAVSTNPVTNYRVQWRVNGAPSFNNEQDVGNVLTYQITGLDSGTQYDVRVAAESVDGFGPYSEIESATTTAAPDQITDLMASPGIISSSMSWSNPASAEPITSLEMQAKQSSQPTSSFRDFVGLTVGQTNQIIWNLTANVMWDFRIRAVSAAGPGEWSNLAQATPTAISVARVGLFREGSLDPSNPVTFWNNSGSAGASWNMVNVVGTGANLNLASKKGKYHIDSAGGAGLTTNSPTARAQPLTHIFCIAPSSLNLNDGKLLGADRTTNFHQNLAFAFNARIFAGTNLDHGETIPVDGTETIFIGEFNTTNSNVRTVINNGTDTNTSGPAGNYGFTLDCMLWDAALTTNADFFGDYYEYRIYDGVLSAAETTAVIETMKQKWWTGEPYLAPLNPV